MRDVRRRERLAGLKRTSRRESRSGPPANIESNQSKERNRQIQPKEEQRLVLRSTPESSVASSFETERSIGRYRRGRHSKWTTGYPYESHLNPNPRCLPSSWFSDPFCTLPGTSELPAMVAHLLYYCKLITNQTWLIRVD